MKKPDGLYKSNLLNAPDELSCSDGLNDPEPLNFPHEISFQDNPNDWYRLNNLDSSKDSDKIQIV